MNTIYIGLFRIPKNIIKEGGGGPGGSHTLVVGFVTWPDSMSMLSAFLFYLFMTSKVNRVVSSAVTLEPPCICSSFRGGILQAQ